MNLSNKTLLVLGGTMLSCEIIRQAKKQGARVYVTDYLKSSPGKKIADKSFMVSTIDVVAVVELIEQEKIDGVLTGFIDMLLPYLFDICQKAGIPCYISSKEQIYVTTEKNQFKALCKRFGVPVVDEYEVQAPFTVQNTSDIKFPVLIKPVDNSGAKGIYICNTLEELQENYPKSLTFSKNKHVLIERYITAREATIFYLVQDGEITLSSMADRHMRRFKEGIIPLPIAYTFPSKYLQQYQNKLNDKVISMFKSIGIENGMIFIQTFVGEEGFIIYEMGYRITGSLEYKIIEAVNDVNPLQCMVNYALTGKMSDERLSNKLNPNHTKLGANVTILIRPGLISKIKGVDNVNNNPKVLDLILSYNEGDKLPLESLGTLSQVVARAFIIADSKEELLKVINYIENEIDVLDENGISLVIRDNSLEGVLL